MSQNQEIIEAKLCAYIDNELDAAGRIEIEKHLEANPQHRRLLEELRRTSALVHDLPHESAPAELAEAFNGQLERSVLLQGISDDAGRSSMRIQRWPQVFAAAAIITLMIGLAAVVYLALPSLTKRPQIVQATPPAAAASKKSQDNQGPPRRDNAGTETEIAERDRSGSNRLTGAPTPLHVPEENSAAASRPPGAGAAGQGAGAGGDALTLARGREASEQLRDLARTASEDPAVQDLLRSKSADHVEPLPEAAALADKPAVPSSPLTARAVVLLVQSENPGQTREALRTYLDSNRIPWESAGETAVDAPGSTLALGPTPADVPKQHLEKEKESGQQVRQLAKAPVAPPAPAPSAAALSNGLTLHSAAQRQASAVTQPSAVANAEAPAPATKPGSEHGQFRSEQSPALDAATAAPSTAPALAGSAPSSALADSGSRDGVYVACRMSRRQAEALQSALAGGGSTDDVQVLGAPASDGKAVDQFALQLHRNRAADRATLRFRAAEDEAQGRRAQSFGSGTTTAPAHLEFRSASTTEPAIGEDDHASVKRELKDRGIGAAAKGLNAGTQPAALADATSEQAPPVARGGAVAGPTTVPSSGEQKADADSTRSTPPALADGAKDARLAESLDEPVDVVIVLQKARDIAPHAAPTTEPAAPDTQPVRDQSTNQTQPSAAPDAAPIDAK